MRGDRHDHNRTRHHPHHRRTAAAAGHPPHRSAAARSERPGTRGHPGARRYRSWGGGPKHSHPGEEIVYAIEGVLEYQLEGKPPVTPRAGEVLFIPAEIFH